MRPQGFSREKASKNSEQTARETFENRGLGSNLPEIKLKEK